MNPSAHRFTQLDVFTERALAGNPLAVVHGADDLDDARMAAFARWTNLSETTFLLAPTEPGADYRVRIFTPTVELPFAGHPTLGSCHAWLAAGGQPRRDGEVVQQSASSASGATARGWPSRRRRGGAVVRWTKRRSSASPTFCSCRVARSSPTSIATTGPAGRR
jgi:predicted PhzF superfamily epimerase YddE/YHI9